jgi:cyclic pyranopterin phosphate synthase
LVREGIVDFVGEIAGMSGVREVAMTTNASLLARHAVRLRAAGLGRLNVSLDTLDRMTARRIARGDVLGSVLGGIEAALTAGFGDLRFNAVVMRGVNDQELGALVRFAHARGATMRFIEYMPMGSARFQPMNQSVSAGAMRERLAEEGFELVRDEGGDPSEPSRNWRCRVTGARVGFISSMTEHFCGTCDRMRLTSEGRLRPCLHQEFEVDVRGRETDEAIAAGYAEAAAGKWAGHRMTQFVPLYSRREMISIGG